jgi:hypothetical protein
MSKGKSKRRHKHERGSGAASIAGYDYQIDVSVWLALDLVLANKFARELVLEPATEEDIEADLGEYEPSRITRTAPLEDYRIIVQAKSRAGDAWTVSGIKTLLKHGKVRESAEKRLADPRARYLLVTTAGLNGGIRGLSVRRAGSWPPASNMPASIESALPAGSAGRVAIIANQDEERLASDIKNLLTESFRVPNARWPECRQALREGARARMRGAGGGCWKRAELEQVIRHYEGYIASSPELEHYVHPTNWAALRAAISERHAALIIGQSGTGKTLATKKLFDELSVIVPGLSLVPVTLGPPQLRDDRTDPPVFYEIEDPWGRFDFDPKSRPWNDQLARFFSGARHDRVIVATSRLDVAQSSGALESLEPWLVALEAEHYGTIERQQLYKTRIEALPRKLQVVAKRGQAMVLKELATPLEIQKFFDALPTLDPKELGNPQKLVTEAVRRAHLNSIESTVINQIQERNDVRAAAVVWGLLKANDKLSLHLLRFVEEELEKRGSQFEKGIFPLVTFFIAARNLRQSETTVTYYHPRVEAGIERALQGDRIVAKKTLSVLVDVLLSAEGSDETWGAGAAARLIAATDRLPALKPEPSQTSQEKIDSWLASELMNDEKRFESSLRVAAAAGSSKSDVSEVARFLLHRSDQPFRSFPRWAPPPDLHEDWYSRMRAQPAVKSLIETFIKVVLPTERDDFEKSFAKEAERVAPGLTGAFLTAAATAVQFGVTCTSDAIAEGAINDLDAFESIVDAAVEVLTPTDAGRQEAEAIHLAIINGEYSEDYAEFLANNDDGYTAGEFLQAYVNRVRTSGDWRRLATHRHRDRLLFYWFRALAEEPEPAPQEVVGAFENGRGTEYEALMWQVINKAWEPLFLGALLESVFEGNSDSEVRIAALGCLVERAPSEAPAIWRRLEEQKNQARLVELAVDLGELRHQESRVDSEQHAEAVLAIVSTLPADLAEISDAAFALVTKKTPALSESALKLVESIIDPHEGIMAFRVRLDEHLRLDVANDVLRLLANTENQETAGWAIGAAIRHSMTHEVNAALTHKFANVVAQALEAVVTPMAAPLPERILALASAKGSPVRRTLVRVLDAKPHPDHLPVLMQLAGDKWSDVFGAYGDEDRHPIARAAVSIIAKIGAKQPAIVEELYRISIDTRDSSLRYEIFRLLVDTADSVIQEQLFELSINPGRLKVRRAAAFALLAGATHVAKSVLARITVEILSTKIEAVASLLLILLAAKADVRIVIKAAQTLATNGQRRVLLLLAIWVLRERDSSAAQRIASMLPKGHLAVDWALGREIGDFNDGLLDDLGDPICIEEVMHFMRPGEKTDMINLS